MLEASEATLRRMGRINAANTIAEIRSELPHDLPIERIPNSRVNQIATSVELRPSERVTFPDETRDALESEGKVIINLSGRSIGSIRESALRFGILWTMGNKDFESITSEHSEAAIDPNQLFIHESNDLPLEEQLKMISEYSEDLSERVPGSKAVMGNAADYTDLMLNFYYATGMLLLGKDYDYGYARTTTILEDGTNLGIGRFDIGHGMSAGHFAEDVRKPNLWAVPLILPSINADFQGDNRG